MVKLQAGQIWRTRCGGYITLYEYDTANDLLTSSGGKSGWVFMKDHDATDNVRSVFGVGTPCDDDLMELFGDNESM